jgi:hypothetical protein
MAEFDTPEQLLAGARAAHAAGYRRMDAFAPFPIEGLAGALGRGPSRLPWLVLAGGVIGCIGGFLLQYWTSVIAYPMNVGGRPHLSWPAFIPVTFETTVLVAALFAVLGMLALNGLPMPYHPVFNVDRFARASRDGYFLCIEAEDKQFDRHAIESLLKRLKARGVFEVEH